MSTRKKDRIVTPLVISKTRIQNVPNVSHDHDQESDLNDGWITLKFLKHIHSPNNIL